MKTKYAVMLVIGFAGFVYGTCRLLSYTDGPYIPKQTVEPKVEFYMRELPMDTAKADPQGADIYEITGHGKKCYVAGFGVSKTTLWCEEEKQ